MYKVTLIILFLLSSTLLKAQLQNPSFEQTDTLGTLSNWRLTQGKATQMTSIQFGVIPFTPYQGNFFVLLESDTLTPTTKRATLEQTFVYADTPGNIAFHYFYIPKSLDQHGQIVLLFTSWNGFSRDTVLYLKDTITAVADSNSIRIQWNVYAKTLKGLYRTSTLPDTAMIIFKNDDAPIAGKDIRLYLDDLHFGQWATGLSEQTLSDILVYPNPAHEILFISCPDPYADYSLTDITGAVVKPESTIEQNGLRLNLRSIPSGLYFLQLKNAQSIFTKRILINHAE
jgi:hypothetical protein